MKDTNVLTQNSDLTLDQLMAVARARTGLDDFGSDAFKEPLSILLKSMREEAELSSSGVTAQSERLINALMSRLRKSQFIKSHPEVMDEEVHVAGVIVSLPRTGSTMLHRLLAASPKFTATRWWETIYPLPLNEDGDDSAERIKAAESLVEKILAAASGFDTIHPLSATAHDEELTLIEQSFMSNMPESMMYVPSYGHWLLQADQSHAYGELLEYLKILQWHAPERRNKKWILKSPHHLTAINTVLSQFPNALIINTHRDITRVMPSWYSMVGSLTKADSNAVDVEIKQADHWTKRLDENLKDFIAARKVAPDRFVDIGYKYLMESPLSVAKMVFERCGYEFGDSDAQALNDHMSENRRDNRPTHQYQLDDYGVTEKDISDRFSYYLEEFHEFL